MRGSYKTQNFNEHGIEKKSVHHISWTKRITIVLMLILFIPLGSLASFIFIGSADAFSFLDTPTIEAPFELLELNENNADYLIESSLADSFLGLEERQARYHLPYGFVGVTYFYKGNNPDAVGNDPSQIACYGLWHIGDSPFLTSHYAFAQALRWAAYNKEGNTQGQKAAEMQISRILDGFYLLSHVSGDPGELVRYAYLKGVNISKRYRHGGPNYVFSSGEICPQTLISSFGTEIVHPTKDFRDWEYYSDNSRDQNLSLLNGLSAIMAFCGNNTLKQRAGAIFCEVVDYLIRSDWQVIFKTLNETMSHTNAACFDCGLFQNPVNVLSFLKVAAYVNPNKYQPLYDYALNALNFYAKLNKQNINFNLESYYPLNLAWIGWWPFAYFEPEDGMREEIWELTMKYYYQPVKNHRNAWFQILWLTIVDKYKIEIAKSRVISEIKDSLQRLVADRLDNFTHTPRGDLDSIGETETSILDSKMYQYATISEVLKNILRNLGDDVANVLNDVFPFDFYTKWALPVDWRRRDGFVWQRCPFFYSAEGEDLERHISTDFDGRVINVVEENPNCDVTILYWYLRYFGFISPPSTPRSPHIIINSEIVEAWPTDTFPVSYINSPYSSFLEVIP